MIRHSKSPSFHREVDALMGLIRLIYLIIYLFVTNDVIRHTFMSEFNPIKASQNSFLRSS